MFTYSPVSKTSVTVTIRLMPSEQHKPGLGESEGTFKARNFRSASLISSPIRIPRNSNGGCGLRAGGRTVNGGVWALRSERTPEASVAAGICAKTDNDKVRIKAPRRAACSE